MHTTFTEWTLVPPDGALHRQSPVVDARAGITRPDPLTVVVNSGCDVSGRIRTITFHLDNESELATLLGGMSG